MDGSWYVSPALCHALTLAERSNLLDEGRFPLSSEANDVERSQGRLTRWQQQPPFDDEAIFAQRLAADGLDSERFGTDIQRLSRNAEAAPGHIIKLDG